MNAQEILWAGVGSFFWRGMAIVATLNAILLFHALLTTAERNALTYGRLLWLGGCICAMFIPWNSGFQPWALAMIITAGAYMSILINIGWCHRRGTFWQKAREVLQELVWKKAQKHPQGHD